MHNYRTLPLIQKYFLCYLLTVILPTLFLFQFLLQGVWKKVADLKGRAGAGQQAALGVRTLHWSGFEFTNIDNLFFSKNKSRCRCNERKFCSNQIRAFRWSSPEAADRTAVFVARSFVSNKQCDQKLRNTYRISGRAKCLYILKHCTIRSSLLYDLGDVD